MTLQTTSAAQEATALASSILDESNRVTSRRTKKAKSWSLVSAKQKIVRRTLLGIQWDKAVLESKGDRNLANKNAPKKIAYRTVSVNKDTDELIFETTNEVVATNSLGCPFWEDTANNHGWVFNLPYGNQRLFSSAVPMTEVTSWEGAKVYVENVCVLMLTSDTFDEMVTKGRGKIRDTIKGISASN